MYIGHTSSDKLFLTDSLFCFSQYKQGHQDADARNDALLLTSRHKQWWWQHALYLHGHPSKLGQGVTNSLFWFQESTAIMPWCHHQLDTVMPMLWWKQWFQCLFWLFTWFTHQNLTSTFSLTASSISADTAILP